MLCFEGPDDYSRAGGLATRVTGLTQALADAGYDTHLWFIGDPDSPGHESRRNVKLHRWCQWISQYHRGGVYDGEEGKQSDFAASLPPFLMQEVVAPVSPARRTYGDLGRGMADGRRRFASRRVAAFRRGARLRRHLLECQQHLWVPSHRLGTARTGRSDHDREPLHAPLDVAPRGGPARDSQRACTRGLRYSRARRCGRVSPRSAGPRRARQSGALGSGQALVAGHRHRGRTETPWAASPADRPRRGGGTRRGGFDKSGRRGTASRRAPAGTSPVWPAYSGVCANWQMRTW